jgi:hypothetical protein
MEESILFLQRGIEKVIHGEGQTENTRDEGRAIFVRGRSQQGLEGYSSLRTYGNS